MVAANLSTIQLRLMKSSCWLQLIGGIWLSDAQSKSGDLLMERNSVEKNLPRKLRAHPLFFGVTMGLLAEIINSR